LLIEVAPACSIAGHLQPIGRHRDLYCRGAQVCARPIIDYVALTILPELSIERGEKVAIIRAAIPR